EFDKSKFRLSRFTPVELIRLKSTLDEMIERQNNTNQELQKRAYCDPVTVITHPL
ncbi:MAG: hypothetical protein GY762_00335, partial [Proteobacteria bacterium]|nr:hypothetical protein [Pseudomonadota bacterium]